VKLVVVVRWSGGARGGMVVERKIRGLKVVDIHIASVLGDVVSGDMVSDGGSNPRSPCFLRYFIAKSRSKLSLADFRHIAFVRHPERDLARLCRQRNEKY